MSFSCDLNLGRRQVLALAGVTAISCAAAPHTRFSPKMGAPPLIVLVAIDGVRHQDVFNGSDSKLGRQRRFTSRERLIPHLVHLERRGTVLGAPGSGGFFASGPNFISLPGYMEMLSGTSRTRCTENNCSRMKRVTLIDEVQEQAAGDPTRSGVFSSWEKVDVAAAHHAPGVVSAGRCRGEHLALLEALPGCREALQRGRKQQAGPGDFRADFWTGQLALSFFEQVLPEFMFVSLGETDERGHEGKYDEYLSALHESDRFVGRMYRALELARSRGRETLLLVTTDHGRADNFRDHGGAYPESARAFLFAAGSLAPARGRIAHEAAYLRDIAPTVRALRGQLEAEPTDDPSRNEGRILRSILV